MFTNISYAKRSLVNCYSQVPSIGVGRSHHEKMKQICEEQLEILNKIDSGYPTWKGDLLKQLSTAYLNLARLVREILYLLHTEKSIS